MSAPAATPASQPLPPPPRPSRDWAWFLDLDGTLLDIAPNPRLVVVPQGLVSDLTSLRRSCGGALALVSGRPVSQVRNLMEPLRPAAAGLHGLEWVTPDGLLHGPSVPLPPVGGVRRTLQEFVINHPGTELENKGPTLALHYRGAPQHEDAARRAVTAALVNTRGFDVIDGKMVLEVRPAGIHKGTAIGQFMAEPPFAGRVPVFVGDDVTDEDGFKTVNQMGGIAIRVGEPRDTAARYGLDSTEACRGWIAEMAEALRRG